MDLGSLLLIFALLLLVGIYISRPLLERETNSVSSLTDSVDHQRSVLMAERDRILNAIQELDFDHALGKIPEEEYPHQRESLLNKGAEVLRNLDALQASTETQYIEDHLEVAIAARKEQKSQSFRSADGDGPDKGFTTNKTIANPDDELEALLASRRRVRKEKAAGFCPRCGRPVQKSDQFCPKCGFKIA